METETSQWDRPPACASLAWARLVDTAGRAYWTCEDVSFYETDADWQRWVDKEGRLYWSSASRQQRFFEPAGAVLE